MNAIVAINKDWAIGKDNDLLFRISSDLKNFKKLTTEKVVIYGRKTLETFPKGAPLKNRLNIILTHNKELNIEDAIIATSIEEVFDIIDTLKIPSEDIFIIGGESIYNQFLPYCNTCYLTKVIKPEREGNKFFPNISDWEVQRYESHEEDEYFYSYKILKNPNPIKFEIESEEKGE